MVPAGAHRGDDLARLALAAVCLVTLVVPIVVGDHTDPVVGPPQSRVQSTIEPRAGGGTSGSDRRRATGPPPAVGTEAQRLAGRLPVGHLAAQVLLVGFEGVDATAAAFAELRDRPWGGLVIGPDNALTVEAVGALAGHARAAAAQAGVTPPLVVAEPSGAPPPPRSARPAPRRVRAEAREAAQRLDGAGVDLVLAPVADVGAGAGPLAEGTFSDDPSVVAALTRASVEGWLAGGVVPAPGHFPGQGAASQDPLDGPAIVGLSRPALADRDLPPFRAALRRAPAVVVSSAAFSAYDPVTPAALVPAVTRRLLRTTLRFDGAALTDDVASLAAATGTSPSDAAVAALRAGIDLVFVPDAGQRSRVHREVVAAARSGRLPVGRLRDAAARVLELKRRAGRLRAPGG